MKVITDLSVTSARRPARTGAPPPPAPDGWVAPSGQAASFGLDFTRDVGGASPAGGSARAQIDFQRASIATCFDKTGALVTVAADVARIDHDPTFGTCRGLLVEEARTNLLSGSAAPVTQTVTVAAVAHTLSFYGTGTITFSGAYDATLSGAGAFPRRILLTFAPDAGALTLTVSGAVQYAQLEAGLFATSFIPTAATAVTRAADLASIPTGGWFDDAAGTWVLSGSVTYADTSASNEVVLLQAKLNNNRMRGINLITNGNRTGSIRNTARLPAFYATCGENELTPGQDRALACAASWDSTHTDAMIAGSALATVPTTGQPDLSDLDWTLGFKGAIHFARVLFFPARLSEADMQALTG